MACAPVQAASAQVTSSTDTTVTVTLGTTTSGNLIVVNAIDNSNLTTPSLTGALSDNSSSTWAVAVATGPAGIGARAGQGYAKNITGRSGHTCTYNPAVAQFPSIAAVEISGADTVSPLDQAPAATGTSGQSNAHVTATTGTTSQAAEIWVAGMTHGGGANETFSDNAGATIQTSQTNTTFQPVVLSTKVLSATQTCQDSYNLTANNSVAQALVIATYKAAAAVVVPPAARRTPQPYQLLQQSGRTLAGQAARSLRIQAFSPLPPLALVSGPVALALVGEADGASAISGSIPLAAAYTPQSPLVVSQDIGRSATR